jgi:proteasome lid subunit RPN8/RPN11
MTSEPAMRPDGGGEPAEPLLLPQDIHAAVLEHCLRESPLECCGLLGGVGKLVQSWHPLRNLAGSETSYQGDPQDLVNAWRWLREHAQEILAIYHSHPRWDAVPSAVDRRDNHWGDMTHLIVSLLTDPPTLRAWRLSSDSQQELPWSLVGVAGEPAVALRPAASAD